jgi:GTP-binding protein
MFFLENGRDCTLNDRPLSSAIQHGERVSNPTFLKSAASPKDFPSDEGREVAFVGRSNSGKSSAINLITGASKLARVSKTPGRTQLINFFVTAPDRRLVDLPGYGFARVPTGMKDRWRELIETYLAERRSLVGLVLTVDIRRGLTALDEQLLAWLGPRELPLVLLLTKADKLSRRAGLEQQRQVVRRVGPEARVLLFSALSREGGTEARECVDSWLEIADVQSQ